MPLTPEIVKAVEQAVGSYLDKTIGIPLRSAFSPEIKAVNDVATALQPVADELNASLTKLELRNGFSNLRKSRQPTEVNQPDVSPANLPQPYYGEPIDTGVSMSPLPELNQGSLDLGLGALLPGATGAAFGAKIAADRAGWKPGEPMSRRQFMSMAVATGLGAVGGEALWGAAGCTPVATEQPSPTAIPTEKPSINEAKISIISKSTLDQLPANEQAEALERMKAYQKAFNESTYATRDGVSQVEATIIRAQTKDKQFEVNLIRGVQAGNSVYFLEYEQNGKIMAVPFTRFEYDGKSFKMLIPTKTSFLIVFEDQFDSGGKLARTIFTNPADSGQIAILTNNDFRRRALDAIGAEKDSDLVALKPIALVTPSPQPSPTKQPEATKVPAVTEKDVQKAIDALDKSKDKGQKMDLIMKNGGEIRSYKVNGKDTFIISSPLKNNKGEVLPNADAIAAVYNTQTKALEMEDELDKYRKLLDNVDVLITGADKSVLPDRDYVTYTWNFRNIKNQNGEFMSIKVLGPQAYKDGKLVFPLWPTPTPEPTKEAPRKFPAEIKLDDKGSVIRNTGKWGAFLVNEMGFTSQDQIEHVQGGMNVVMPTGGKMFVPDSNIVYNSYFKIPEIITGKYSQDYALSYLHYMFAKYGNLPDGGNGKKLILEIGDKNGTGEYNDFGGYESLAKYIDGGKTIYVRIGLGTDPNSLSDQAMGRLSYEINTPLANLLNGEGDVVVNGSPHKKIWPKDLEALVFPAILSLR